MIRNEREKKERNQRWIRKAESSSLEMPARPSNRFLGLAFNTRLQTSTWKRIFTRESKKAKSPLEVSILSPKTWKKSAVVSKNSSATDKPARLMDFLQKTHQGPAIISGKCCILFKFVIQATFFHGHLERSALRILLTSLLRQSSLKFQCSIAAALLALLFDDWLKLRAPHQLSHRAEKKAFRKTAKNDQNWQRKERKEKKSKVETDRNAQASGLGFLLFLFIARSFVQRNARKYFHCGANTSDFITFARIWGEIVDLASEKSPGKWRRRSRAIWEIMASSKSFWTDAAGTERLIQLRFTYKLKLRN